MHGENEKNKKKFRRRSELKFDIETCDNLWALIKLFTKLVNFFLFRWKTFHCFWEVFHIGKNSNNLVNDLTNTPRLSQAWMPFLTRSPENCHTLFYVHDFLPNCDWVMIWHIISFLQLCHTCWGYLAPKFPRFSPIHLCPQATLLASRYLYSHAFVLTYLMFFNLAAKMEI